MIPAPAPRRRIVLVSGAPGAGKSTLALPLAKELGLPLFSKDAIKESLMETLDGPTGDLAFSRRIGDAAIELLWQIARSLPAAILDANFKPHNERQRSKIASLDADVVEVYCECPPAEAARRFAERARTRLHPAHPLQELTDEMLADYDGPVGVDTVIRVSTTASVDVAAIGKRIREAWDMGAVDHA